MTRAEGRATCLQAKNTKDCCPPTEAGRGREEGALQPWGLGVGHGPSDALILDFWPLECENDLLV